MAEASAHRVVSKSVFGQAATYGLMTALSMAIPLLLAPILTHYLTPADYGIVALLSMTVALTNPLVGVGTQSAIRRRYFDHADQELSSYVMSCFAVVGILLGAMALVTVGLQAVLPEDSELPPAWLLVLAPWIAAEYLVSIAKTFLQLEEQAVGFGLVQGTLTATELGLSLLFVVVLGFGWQGRVLGHVGAEALFGLFGAWLVLRRIDVRQRPRAAHVRDALQFGLPTVPYAMMERIIAFTDRALVVAMVGLAAGGTYTLAAQIASMLLAASQSFSVAWQPWLYARLKEGTPEGRRRSLRALWTSLLCLPVGAALLIWLAPIVLPYMIDESFLGCLELIPWLAAAYAARSTSLILSAFVLFEGRTAILTTTTVLGAAINLAGSLVLIPRFGAQGAVHATFLAFTITALAMAAAARRAWARTTR